jgi:hypothetical protein|tara:strand:+ start:219 stop:371 length:153 start_codon:yes stop_codon:yes gene_type:complete
MTYLEELIRNSLALSYELNETELVELLEDAIQEIERLEIKNHLARGQLCE